MTPILKGCWLAWGLTLLCPFEAWCESPNAPGTDYSVQRRFVQDKYEKSLRQCYQKFAVSDCKQDATVVLNSELSALKNIEAEKMQSVRAQNTQEKMQSLARKAPTASNDVVNLALPKTWTDVKAPEPSKKRDSPEPGVGASSKSAQEEQAQRKRFEEKQLHAQQHRDAVEKRWMDKKGVKATQISQTP
jgi:hypothetical protein